MPDTLAKPLCGFVPYPDNGAYGQWTCQLPRRHRGPHRFVNYTIARFPRVWHLRGILRSLRTTRRLRGYARREGASPQRFRYLRQMRQLLYPATYRPIEPPARTPIRPRCACEVAPVDVETVPETEAP